MKLIVKSLPILPTDLITYIMRFLGEEVMLNVTTGEYIQKYTIDQLKSLLRKKTKETADFRQDIGESHWKRTDKIIIVPLHLELWARDFYTKLDL
jgi:hypothetical protein